MKKFFLAFSLFGLCIGSLFAQHAPLIDLNEAPLYVRQGFNRSFLTNIPSDDPAWQLFPAVERGGRTVRLTEIHAPDKPKSSFITDWKRVQMEFTYLIAFDVDTRFLDHFTTRGRNGSIPIPAIHLASLGDNWEIYLNGELVRSEMHLDWRGIIERHTCYRDIQFTIPLSVLKNGQNILALRVIGDPNFPTAGMFHNNPYLVGDFEDLVHRSSELIALILIGLYLFIGIYHISIFMVRKQDRYNIFYALFSIDLAIYLFSRTHTVYQFIQDSEWVFRIETCALYMILPLAGIFLEVVSDNRATLITRINIVFCLLASLFITLVPVKIGFYALNLWYMFGAVFILYYFFYQMVWRFLNTGYRHWKHYRNTDKARSLMQVYLHNLGKTPIGNLLIGGSIMFATGLYDMIDAFMLDYDLVLTRYGFSIFTMGTSIVLANRFSFLFGQVNDLNRNLERQVLQLSDTTQKLRTSETKYRSLFEGSTDPIALVDDNLDILEGNPAAIDLFGLERRDRESVNLKDCVWLDKREGIAPVGQLTRMVAQLVARKESVEASIRLRTVLGEPKPCRLRMEYIRGTSGHEILLRVMSEALDLLVPSFKANREVYAIDSNLIAADKIARRMAGNVARYLPQEDANFIMVCLREMIINAIEHGNLKITYAEKTQAQKRGNYFDFVQSRQQQAPYRDRKVYIDYTINAEKASFTIRDAGEGFNHKTFLEKCQNQDDPSLEHGRGLLMTLAAFDTVQYNAKGNEVTLIKNFRTQAAKA